MPVRQPGVRPLSSPVVTVVPGLPPVLPPPPPPAVHLDTFTLSVATIEAGQGLTGTLTLDGVAPSPGLSLALTSSDPRVGVPAQAVVAPGETQVDVPITTEEAATAFSATLTATDATITKTAILAVTATPTPPPPPVDTTAPTIPTGLTLSGIARTTAQLGWQASTDAVGVVGYGIYRDGVRIATTTALTVDLTGLVCGTAYVIQVDAVDAAGNRSGVSDPAVLVTNTCEDDPPPPPPGDTTAPTVPTGVFVSGITQIAAQVSWNPSTDAVGVVRYTVYRDGTPVATPSTPGAGLTGLACATTYSVEIDALDAAGNRSAKSTAVAFTTAACDEPPPPPVLPKVADLTLAPSTVVGGNPVTGTVTLDRVAPAGGIVVSLSSSASGVATIPATVLVLEGETQATVPITTSVVAASQTVTITGSAGGATVTASLTVTAIPVPPPTVSLTSLSVTPSTVVGGIPATVTPRLTGPAPTGGTPVTFVVDPPRLVSLPALTTIPAGQTQLAVSAATVVPALAPVSLRTIVSPAAPAGGSTVSTSAALTAALLVGGTIRLAANTTFTGQFSVSVTGTKLIGGAGSKIVGGSSGIPALLVPINVDNILIQGDPVTGLEVVGTTNQAAVRIGANDATQTTVGAAPDTITLIDVRVLSHRGKRAFELNSATTLVLNCWGIEVWDPAGQDSQGIAIFNAVGPITIRGGKYSAASECLLVGGDTMKIVGTIPSTILIEDVDLYKPLSWRTDTVAQGPVKNDLELKTGSGVTIRRCHMHGSWADGQDGEAIVLTPAAGGIVENVVIEDCAIWDCGSCLEYLGRGQNSHTPRPLTLIFRRNLVITDKVTFGGFGMLARGGAEPLSLVFQDNVVIIDGSSIVDHFAGTVIEADEVTTRPGGKIGTFTFTGNRSIAPSLGLRFLGQNNGTLIANAVTTWTVTGNIFGDYNRMQGVFPTNTYLDRATFDSRLAEIPGSRTARITAVAGGVSRSALLTVTSRSVPPPADGRYAYFDALVANPACTHAYPMRSVAQIDPKQTPGMDANKVTETRLPWIYDPVEDSAAVQVHPAAGFIEPQTRRLTTGTLADRRSILFTFDFKYDPGWYWHGEGYMKNYKNWYLYCNGRYWIQATHGHLHVGAQQDPPGVVATGPWLWLGVPGTMWQNPDLPKLVGEPDSYRIGERLEPQEVNFYAKLNRWTRHWFFIEGTQGDNLTTSLIHLSTWFADTDRDPITVYDRVPMHSLAPLTLWSFSYDTSAEGLRLNPLATKWIRNVAVLRGLTLAEVQALLVKPVVP